MNVKMSFWPPRTTQNDDFKAIVKWDPVEGASEYTVVVDPGILAGEKRKTISRGEELSFEPTFTSSSSVATGDYTVVAKVCVSKHDDQGRGPIEGKCSKTISVGNWVTPNFVYGIKENFDEVVGAISEQLRATNTNGIQLKRATDPFSANPLRLQFWSAIRQSTARLQWSEYTKFMDAHFCNQHLATPGNMRMPFSQVDAYLRLKACTELFLLNNAGVVAVPGPLGLPINAINANVSAYAVPPPPMAAAQVAQQIRAARPYMQTILDNNPDIAAMATLNGACDRLRYPLLIELIWSYWHEESMMVQAMAKIKRRFQNRTDGPGRDPLAQFEMDPLRPLNNILWGYIQDEQHRLGVQQRDCEYRHEYGHGLEGRAVNGLRAADSRTRFLQTFHNLLYQSVLFFRQADDATVVANAGPVLYALRDLHYVLAEGAHNQFGDLPWNARLEMLLEQWILSRPEIQDFLRGRRMVPYPAGWMGSVDTMKTIQGWSGTSVVHFGDLATFGEQIILSVREGGVPGLGGWSRVIDPMEAAAWALVWRPEIEGYIHAYRAATGIDLATDPTDPRFLAQRDMPPSIHLQRRLTQEGAR